MDEKIKIAFKSPEIKSISFGDQIIKVKTYISLAEQKELIQFYIQEYFEPSSFKFTPYDLLEAEYVWKVNLIDICSNIELFSEDQGKTTSSFTIDDIISHSDLWLAIVGSISNYNEVLAYRQEIVKIITDQMALDKSIGSAITNVYTKLMAFLNDFANLDFSDEQIGKLKSLLSDIEKSPILNEATKIFKSGKSDSNSPTPLKKPRKKRVKK